jgi:hypothetical protein
MVRKAQVNLLQSELLSPPENLIVGKRTFFAGILPHQSMQGWEALTGMGQLRSAVIPAQ